MKIDNILDIEDILYNGSREEIRQLIKKYQISYSYDENRNFSIKSLKLLETTRGYKSNSIPNCVKYFGNKI